MENAKITLLTYSDTVYQLQEISTIADLQLPADDGTTVWLNIDGVLSPEDLEKIGEIYNIHPLVFDDITNTGKRPKTVNYDDYIYISLKNLYFADNEEEIISEEISLVLGKNFVLTFQENAGDVFLSLQNRIKVVKSKIRTVGADYLSYLLLDLIIDNYFVILDKLGEKLEILEDKLVSDPGKDSLNPIHTMKRRMLVVRKAIWPLREIISGLERFDSPLIKEETKIYLRDIYDHTIEVIDTTEIYRDMLSGMLDIYLSSISNKTNEVMKVLTVISTIFIPLTFIVGVYGMNFVDMPELKMRWSYPILWFVMVGLAGMMVAYFKKKKWF